MINIFKKKITDKYESKDEISDVIELKWSEEIEKASEADKEKFKSALEDYKTDSESKMDPNEVFSKFNEGGTTNVLDFIKEIKQETEREKTRYQQAIDENLPLLENEVVKEPELYIFFSLRFIYLSLKLYLAFFLLLLITFFIYIVINIALKKSSSKVEIPIFPNDVLFKTLVKCSIFDVCFTEPPKKGTILL